MYTLLRCLLLDGGLRLALLFDGFDLFLLLLGSLGNLAEAIHTSGCHETTVFTGVDGMAETADFDLLRLHRRRDVVFRAAGNARRNGVFVHLGVDSFLHSREILGDAVGKGKRK